MDLDLLACLIELSLSTHHHHHRELGIICFTYHQTFEVGVFFNCSSISYFWIFHDIVVEFIAYME